MAHMNHSDGGETFVSPDTSDAKLADQNVSEAFKETLFVTNKVHIMVYQGDITQEMADAIVNPSNEYLNHCAGAALAIVKNGGKSIQKQCDKTIKKRERLEPGDIVTTPAGKLPCKFIIHAVGPRWSNHTEEESRQLLRLTCQNSLKAAVKKRARHVVIPAISAGKFGMPTEVCAEELFNAVQTFCSKETKLRKLKEIRFVNIDDPTVQVFKQELEKRRGVQVGEMNEDKSDNYSSGFSDEERMKSKEDGSKSKLWSSENPNVEKNKEKEKQGDWKMNSAITSSNKAKADKETQKDKQLNYNDDESALQLKRTYKENPSHQATSNLGKNSDYPLETQV